MRWITLAALATLAACGNGAQGTPDLSNATCAADGRGMTYLPGMTLAGAKSVYTVKLLSSDPAPPIKGNNTWMVEIDDAGGKPVPGAMVTVVPFMPDHGHGTRTVVVTDMGGGQYKADPLYLFMSGVWQITVTSTANAMTDQSVFYFCVEG